MSNNSITETRILMNFMILYFVNLEILWGSGFSFDSYLKYHQKLILRIW